MRHLVAIACLALVLCTLPLASSQQKTKAGQGQSRLDLEKDWSREGEELRTFLSLKRGERQVTEADKPILDYAAKWFAYRLTHSEYQEPRPQAKGMQEIRREAMDQIVDLKRGSATQAAFMEAFSKPFVAALMEVSKNQKAIARLNATMLLAQMAKSGVEEAADALLEIISDENENDGIKLWAFRGLNDLLATTRGQGGQPLKMKDREAKCAQGLLSYVSRKVTPPKEAGPRELAALSLVRAEAVAALGQTRYPAVSKTENKVTKLERLTALELLKLLRKDGVTLKPTITEQVYAAVALLQLEPRLAESYNLDYALYHIGQFLVEFAAEYNDRDNEDKATMKEAWKLHAGRLLGAINELKTDPLSGEAGKYSSAFADVAATLVNEVIEAKTGRADPTKLAAWLEQNKPKSTSLYKGLADSVVNAAATTENNP